MQEGVRLLSYHELDGPSASRSITFSRRARFRFLTPMAIDPSHPSPHFHNRQLYLAAMLERHHGLAEAVSSRSCSCLIFYAFCSAGLVGGNQFHSARTGGCGTPSRIVRGF